MPHLERSRPGFGGDKHEADQHDNTGRVGEGGIGALQGASREERGHILDEFTVVTGFHRKHAVRLLRGGAPVGRCGPRPGRRVYDVAVREAVVVVWEASDRVCGKRLRPLVPLLVDAMERHGHLQLAPKVRGGLLAMSSAAIDRALGEVRGQAGGGARRAAPSKRLITNWREYDASVEV